MDGEQKMKNKNQVVIFDDNKFQELVKESGLEQSKAQILLDNFSDYFKIADEWEKKAKAISVTDVTQTAVMKMAGVGRKFIANKRIELEKTRKELKEQSLREGKAIDGIANALKAVLAPIEEYLRKQEKFVEIKQREEDARIRAEAKAKAEDERLAAEEAERKERERVRQENIILQKQAEERERLHKKEREEAEARQKAIEEKHEAERKVAEAKRKEEKAKLEAILKQKEAELEKELLKEKALRDDAEKAKKELNSLIECPFCKKKFNYNQNK